MIKVSYNCEYMKSLTGRDPYVKRLKFNSGTNQLVSPGQICVLSGGFFTPLAADQAMSSVVAVAIKRIVTADLAGFYEAIIPRPGDIFRVNLATASAILRGASLYMTDTSGTTQNMASSGSNVIGVVEDTAGYPIVQGNADVGDVVDRGTTIASVNWVLMTFKASVSYYGVLNT